MAQEQPGADDSSRLCRIYFDAPGPGGFATGSVGGRAEAVYRNVSPRETRLHGCLDLRRDVADVAVLPAYIAGLAATATVKQTS